MSRFRPSPVVSRVVASCAAVVLSCRRRAPYDANSPGSAPAFFIVSVSTA
ncbi:hypothetical protein [Streptomyces sp. NPDC020141]